MFARARSRARVLTAATLFVAAGSLVAPPARAQSLADIAKKEEDRRKSVAVPSKVYTNKDLNPVPAGSPPPPASAAKPSDDAAKAADDTTKAADGDAKAGSKSAASADKGAVKDQAYWAGRLKTLQDALSRDENYADAMQTRINALTTDFVNRDDPAQRAVIETNRQKSIAELARLTKSVQDTKKAIADFYEEARRAGVPPGWLR
jgi:hypothetical protein